MNHYNVDKPASRLYALIESSVNLALASGKLEPVAMRAVAANLRSLADSLDTMANSAERKEPADESAPRCTHGVTFDPKDTRLTSDEVRRKYPRLNGDCPLGCGYHGIAYASMAHYVAGDW